MTSQNEVSRETDVQCHRHHRSLVVRVEHASEVTAVCGSVSFMASDPDLRKYLRAPGRHVR
jgi:hypothetical protein